jgi:hypothetical protein
VLGLLGEGLSNPEKRPGMTVTSTRTHVGTAKYPSIDDAVTTELEATPLGEMVSGGV